MGIADKVWSSLADVLKMSDKVERLATKQADLSEDHTALTERVIELKERIVRLEATIETMLMMAGAKKSTQKRISRDADE
jgi:methylphosphotriester-DNA--protein-cysteine methyltransferase